MPLKEELVFAKRLATHDSVAITLDNLVDQQHGAAVRYGILNGIRVHVVCSPVDNDAVPQFASAARVSMASTSLATITP